MAFQRPVAAFAGVAGGIGGGGNVGAGELGELPDEGIALFALGNVAAIEKNVGIRREMGGPGLQGIALRGKAL
nr:hypothetical protein [Methylomicrobium album]